MEEGRATLEDLGSKNGTFIGEQRVESPVELRQGDRIVIGPVELVFRVASAEAITSTEAR